MNEMWSLYVACKRHSRGGIGHWRDRRDSATGRAEERRQEGEWCVQARRNGRAGGTVGETTEGVEAQSAQGTKQAVCLTFRESFTQEIPRQQT